MRITELKYENVFSEWKLETTNFSNLTLLVGISGVGKSRILDSIWRLKAIADGKPSNGTKWNISFIASNGDNFCWIGEYENKVLSKEESLFSRILEINNNDDENNQPKLLSEKLIRNGDTVVERVFENNLSTILLKGNKTPKLSPSESVLKILNQEDDISPAYESFKRIIKSDFSEGKRSFNFDLIDYRKKLQEKPSLEEIKESTLDSSLKVALLYKLFPKEFDKITARFIEVFPQITDVRFDSLDEAKGVPVFLDRQPFLQIKERNVKNWIFEFQISSGMYKTFMHISELLLLPRGTVILIDEFENSLGVNCIDVLTEDLLQESKNLQFIVTSHHPYIINSIATKYWKVVTRDGGVVKTQDVKELNMPKSKHEAFLQLLNLEEFREGIAV